MIKKSIIMSAMISLILVPMIGHAESKSYWLPGMGIGMIGGATLGLIAGIAGRCTTTSDPGDCSGMRKAAIVVGTTGGFVIGGGIGAGVGALIKKKPTVTLSPTLSVGPEGLTGGGLGISGGF